MRQRGSSSSPGRALALALLALALVVRVLVPQGWMPGEGRFGFVPCPAAAPVAPPAAAAMPGMHHAPGRHDGHEAPAADHPCAFAGLSLALLGAGDPVQLVAPIAFVLAAELSGVPLPPPLRRAHLRPPLRGPPATP